MDPETTVFSTIVKDFLVKKAAAAVLKTGFQAVTALAKKGQPQQSDNRMMVADVARGVQRIDPERLRQLRAQGEI